MKKNITFGIIGALNQEIAILHKKIQFHKKEIIFGKKFYIGKLNNINIILVKSNVGKVASSMSCTILLSVYKIDLIINVGTAGSLQEDLKPGHIILPNSTCYYDVDLTAFGYNLGKMQNLPQSFLTDKKMLKLAETCILKFSLSYKKNLIISGDTFINKKTFHQNLKKYFPKAIAVDMESTAIAQVCYQFKKPFLIIKVISDNSDRHASKNFKENIHSASKKYSKVLKNLLKIYENKFKI
ncbi:hypothetical protein XW81_00970 [Buchnera aphidicola (Schlechtendalia chinensis)]|uniref:adenosylhomocysteine nucleosidase n=1 Tax=Buchnera aphidicola subsp. Schlechtendalia chinensis TaxID=118110 RepID=A0A172WDI7_BUCSC|nr:5'-methylthioadenosine/adenosylhomocysteine nucleosidase [Buchnera aphidicola]ANF16995.1 hypothetical protein XW81_00970 [Buchnera aphidicola (Schlechtendalia chinensis)]